MPDTTPKLPEIGAKLGAPARRALINAGWTTLAELARHTRQEVLALHGMGPSAMRQLHAALLEQGLDFAATEK